MIDQAGLMNQAFAIYHQAIYQKEQA